MRFFDPLHQKGEYIAGLRKDFLMQGIEKYRSFNLEVIL